METQTSNSVPVGAVWVKSWKLRNSIELFIKQRTQTCPKCHHSYLDDLRETEQEELYESITNHTMILKVKTLREKFIAIYNPRKIVSTHPDYFLYVYQAYTGAASVYPFAFNSSKSEDWKTQAKTGTKTDSLNLSPPATVAGQVSALSVSGISSGGRGISGIPKET